MSDDAGSVTLAELSRLLDTFIEGGDRSRALAGRIEVALDELFGDQEPFASAALALASYLPGGGEYLYDEHYMVRELQFVRRSLADRPAVDRLGRPTSG